MNGTVTIAEAGPYPYTSPMTATLIGYARCSTDRLARSVPDARAIADQLRQRGVKLALGRTLYDPDDPMGKLFFNIPATFAEFEADLIRMKTHSFAPARAWPSPAPRGNCAANSPNCPTDSSGNSTACMPPASIPSAISPSSSPSQDQPSIARSTGAIPLRAYPNNPAALRAVRAQAK